MSKGQGTIEYLVIIGIVVVIALVVVSLLINQTSNFSATDQKATNLAWKTKELQIVEFVSDSQGNGTIVLSNTGNKITLRNIVIDSVSNSSTKQLFSGSKQVISLSNLTSCTTQNQSYDVTINYSSSEGLNKSVNGKFFANCLPIVRTPTQQFILVGVDGLQLNHFKTMLDAGTLPNFTRLIGTNGFDGNLTITGHTTTATNPGNAELNTGLGSSVTLVSDNTPRTLSNGITTFEKLRTYRSDVKTGVIYGKNNGYIPHILLDNAEADINWFMDMGDYTHDDYISSTYANCISVATKADEFIASYKDNNFYLLVYFGVPDGAGHASGENSAAYDSALINVDDGLGDLLDSLENYDILNNVKIIVTADHGWNENTTNHNTNNLDTNTVPLISNDSTIVGTIYGGGKRRQCDIAPTTLAYFGLTTGQYSEINSFGCGSLINP